MSDEEAVRQYLVQIKQNCFPWEESVENITQCAEISWPTQSLLNIFFNILWNYFINCVIFYLAITSEERVHKFQGCPARTEGSRGEVLPHRCAVPSKGLPLFPYLYTQRVIRKVMLIEFILPHILTLTDNMKIILDTKPWNTTCFVCVCEWFACTANHSHTQQVGICRHSTGNAHINKRSGTIPVILAKHWLRLPDDGSYVNRNMSEQILYF